jgi:hypothetical protein
LPPESRARKLGAEAGALTDERQTILGAIDFLLTGL